MHNNRNKGLSPIRLMMLALGTIIGGSFFLGSSVPIKASGPSILLAFLFGGILVYYTLFALSEMTVSHPCSGSFQTFATEAYGPLAGFVTGWTYWTGMVLAMSSEATAISILMKNWFPNIKISILGTIIIILVTLLNLLGADQLSKLEGCLAIIKILAIVAFIVIGLLLITGLMPNHNSIGAGALKNEPLLSNGIKGIAGSMLMVMFAYAGFEIIGLAASETSNPDETIPKAIHYTTISLVTLYVLCIGILLPLIPTNELDENTSPFVAALNQSGMQWAGSAINIILIIAILSTMLAAMFGLGRMMRSLADVGHAPHWLSDKKNVPSKGIVFSGLCMILGLILGLFLPSIYLFLVSSGGFSILFTYLIIVCSHIKFRKQNGCPTGKCKVSGYPYSSLFVLISMILILISMPLIPGQSYGFIAGIAMIIFFIICYYLMQFYKTRQS